MEPKVLARLHIGRIDQLEQDIYGNPVLRLSNSGFIAVSAVEACLIVLLAQILEATEMAVTGQGSGE